MVIVSVVVNTADFYTKNRFLILDLVGKRRLVCHYSEFRITGCNEEHAPKALNS